MFFSKISADEYRKMYESSQEAKARLEAGYIQHIEKLKSEHLIAIKELEAENRLALKDKEFELKHFKDDEIKKLEKELSEKDTDLKVVRKELELTKKIVELDSDVLKVQSDVLDVKGVVNKLIEKLPEIKISSLNVSGNMGNQTTAEKK